MKRFWQCIASAAILVPSAVGWAQTTSPSGTPTASSAPGGAPSAAPSSAPSSPAATSAPTSAAPQPPADLESVGKKLEEAAKSLESASSKLEGASKKLEKTSSTLSQSSNDAKELLSGRVTWNGVFFRFTEKQKRATAATSIPVPGGASTLGLEVTAPLDETTRRAPLLDAREQPNPFRFKLTFDYNSLTDYLKALSAGPESSEAQAQCEAFMKETGQVACRPSEESFQRWLRAKTPAARPESPTSRGIPLGVRWTLGVEVDGGFDRMDVYNGDLGEDPVQLTRTDLSLNGVFRWYPTSWLAIPIRVGAGLENTFRAREVERCTLLTSTKPSVTGTDCAKVLLLTSDERFTVAASAEAAFVVAPPLPGLADLQPGFEVRGRVEGIGANELLRISSTLFVSPTSQPLLSRFGVGVEYSRALADDENTPPSFVEGEDTLTPFILFGASL